MLSGVSCAGAFRFPSVVIGIHWEKNTENFTKLISTCRFDFTKENLRGCEHVAGLDSSPLLTMDGLLSPSFKAGTATGTRS